MDKRTKIIFELFVIIMIVLLTVLICETIFEPEVVVQMSGAKLYYDGDGNVTQTETDYAVQKEKLIEGIPEKIEKVNINTASKTELMTIPEIGEKMAERIIKFREESPFESVEDLKKVEGIGDKTLEKIIEYIEVN